MTWGEIFKAAAALVVDLARDWVKERREERAQGWTYRDVKIANDASLAAGHERDGKRNPQR